MRHFFFVAKGVGVFAVSAELQSSGVRVFCFLIRSDHIASVLSRVRYILADPCAAFGSTALIEHQHILCSHGGIVGYIIGVIGLRILQCAAHVQIRLTAADIRAGRRVTLYCNKDQRG